MFQLNIKNLNIMELRKSNRSQARIRMALQGPSGSGKTYSALLLAYGLCKDWNKIAVIDTENKSADLYSHLGNYNVLALEAPFTPERYSEAIDACERAGMDVIIIDSISHEWENLIDFHASIPGNSFANWAKVTPRHNALVQRILSSGKHIITTVRSKQEYVIAEKNGKNIPEKVGMKGVQRDGIEYEFTIVFELDINHNVNCTKDRTQIFNNKATFKIDQNTGIAIAKWCKEGEGYSQEEIYKMIRSCKTLEELNHLHKHQPSVRTYSAELNHRAAVIKGQIPEYKILQEQLNGQHALQPQ